MGDRDDLGALVTRLREDVGPARVDKALQMLRSSRFQLFSEVTGDVVQGVIHSQSDPDLVYSCRLESGGRYYCCTQNLYACGGLRGAPCKHILLLLIGLAQVGEIEAARAQGWLAAALAHKPSLDKDLATQTLLRHKGAEAGEIDWRPTETVPEDFMLL